MKKTIINRWIRYFFPVVLSLILGALIFMMAQFREPPGLSLYSLTWFSMATFLIWETGWRISQTLDRKHPWRQGVFKRLMLQLLSVLMVGMLLFLGLFVLFNLYENRVLGHDNPLGFLHLLVSSALGLIIVLIISSVQIGYLLLQSWQEIELEAVAAQREQVLSKLNVLKQLLDTPVDQQPLTSLSNEMVEYPEEVNTVLTKMALRYQQQQDRLSESVAAAREVLTRKVPSSTTISSSVASSQKYKNRFLVRTGSRFFLIRLKDVVAFYKDDLVLIYTKSGKKFSVDYSLDQLMNQLDPTQFFRINRQCIIHVSYLEEMRMEKAQMELTLAVAFPHSLFVSQRNVPSFRRWLGG